MKFRFFGAKSTIGTHKLEKLGQVIELSHEQAASAGCTKEELRSGRAPFLLPDDLYKSIGFTADDESRHTAATMARWTPEFRVKWMRALVLRSEWLNTEKPESDSEPEPEPELKPEPQPSVPPPVEYTPEELASMEPGTVPASPEQDQK